MTCGAIRVARPLYPRGAEVEPRQSRMIRWTARPPATCPHSADVRRALPVLVSAEEALVAPTDPKRTLKAVNATGVAAMADVTRLL